MQWLASGVRMRNLSDRKLSDLHVLLRLDGEEQLVCLSRVKIEPLLSSWHAFRVLVQHHTELDPSKSEGARQSKVPSSARLPALLELPRSPLPSHLSGYVL